MQTRKRGRHLFVISTPNLLTLTRETMEFALYVRELERKAREGGGPSPFAPRTLKFAARVGELLPRAVGGDLLDLVEPEGQQPARPSRAARVTSKRRVKGDGRDRAARK